MEVGFRGEIAASLQRIGRILRDGDFVESPFDQPVEEERLGDPDQRDDDAYFQDQTACSNLEPSLAGGKKTIGVSIPSQRFRYFLDGSLRTKYLGDYVDGQFSFPVLATENVSAVVQRDRQRLSLRAVRHQLVFVFPHKGSGLIADTAYEQLEELAKDLATANSEIKIDFLLKEEVARDTRYAMLGKARNLMHRLEHDVAGELQTDPDNWLVMDGAIRKAEFMSLKNTIGLAKSFSRRPLFDLGDGNRRMITSYLSNVRSGERSAVFWVPTKDGPVKPDLIFWYVRLRTYPPMEPLGGLVKIDYSLKGTDFTPSIQNLVDAISAELFAMRLPSVYAYPRWPSFVYPIRVAELTMKSRFLNPEVIGYYGHLLKRAIQEAKNG